MLTLAVEEKNQASGLIYALPEKIRIITGGISFENVCEIRLRRGMPLVLVNMGQSVYITAKGRVTEDYREGYFVTERDIKRGMELITKSSVYAYEDEIQNGYVTVEGGHRVGICGEVVVSEKGILQMRAVQSLNYRFAREVIGCADSVMSKILSPQGVKNTLLVSPPMKGKTTMLRDIARQLSLMGKRVSIVDERREIAACSDGVPAFELGANCDVLSGAPKAEGMMLMLRSMSPEVIITDEIGGEADFAAIREIKKRGVKIITSLHGEAGEFSDFDQVIYLKEVGKCLS